MTKVKHSALVWLWLSVFIIVIDQLSKYYIDTHFSLYESVAIFPWLNITLRYNTGAAFSFLAEAGGWQLYVLAGISIQVSIVVILWLRKVPAKDWLSALALSLILGGALGNLIDRIRLHYVIDFIDFHIGTWHFATINVADSAISVGAFLLVVKLLFFSNKSDSSN